MSNKWKWRYALSVCWPLIRGIRAITRQFSIRKPGCVTALMYHDIGRLQQDAFQLQMEQLARQYEVLDTVNFCSLVNNGANSSGVRVLVTFDDGFYSGRVVAKKILEPLGIKALFFIPTGFIQCQTRNEQRRYIAHNIAGQPRDLNEVLDEQRPMGWDDLKYLVSQGHAIGAHTCYHSRLASIDSQAGLEEEILGCADVLERMLDYRIETFAFPFGAVDNISECALTIAKRRYKYVFSGVRGTNGNGVNPMGIRRDSISPTDPIGYFRFVVEGGLWPYYWRDRRRLDRLLAGSEVLTA